MENQLKHSIYPNPVKTIMFVEIENSEGKSYSIRILSAEGNIIKTQQGVITCNTVSMCMTGVASGTYLADIKTRNQHFIQRIIVEL